MLTLPEVMENLRGTMPDLSDSELAMGAATLMVSYEWQQAGKLPTSSKDLWPDIQLLLVAHGYKIDAS